jgi:hypothetical protein
MRAARRDAFTLSKVTVAEYSYRRTGNIIHTIVHSKVIASGGGSLKPEHFDCRWYVSNLQGFDPCVYMVYFVKFRICLILVRLERR